MRRFQKIINKSLVLAGCVALALWTNNAFAAFTLDITPNPAIGEQGSTLSFLAELRNDTLDSVTITGLNSNVTGDDVTWDDNEFLFALPDTLAPGEVYLNNLHLIIGGAAIPDVYIATYSVDGDANGSPVTATSFTSVTVTTVVPEAGTITLLTPILLVALGFGYQKQGGKR